jgi:hypothetical protein
VELAADGRTADVAREVLEASFRHGPRQQGEGLEGKRHRKEGEDHECWHFHGMFSPICI